MNRWLPLSLAVVAVLANPAVSRECPQARPATLEDIFGESGENFQAALGILTLEGETGNAAVPGFGLAIDDMVMEWREIELAPDAADCATDGACASIEFETTSFYEGSASVEVTLVDADPFQSHCDGGTSDLALCFGAGDCPGGTCTATFNDCDEDGDYIEELALDPNCGCGGAPGDAIVVNARSEAEVDGESVCLFDTGAGNVFVGNVAISSTFDVDDVLFLQQSGQDFPSITASYRDLDDGSGGICRNDIDPAKRGLVENISVVFLTTGSIVVTGFALTDNGDDDGFADDNETITLELELSNKTGIPLTDVVARLSSNDPDVDCILDAFASTAAMAVDETLLLSDTFEFRIGDVGRAGLFDELTAEFVVNISSNEVQATITPQRIELALDLDAAISGQTLETYLEDFEGGVSGSSFAGTDFELDDLDAPFGIQDGPSLDKSDGYRCTYNDPDWVNANDPGRTSCYLNDWNTGASGPAVFTPTWRVINRDDAGTAGIARSVSGTRSASFSIDIAGIPNSTTTPFATLEAIRSRDPIDLGVGRFCSDSGASCVDASDCGVGASCDGANPTLSFKHQISLLDSRTVSVTQGESADSAVAHLQLANAAGAPVGDWRKLFPVQNVYDQQGTNNFFNCKFDPIDDGNTEDSFFDPLDPQRNNGPSSTCFPSFVWAYLGSTDGSFDPADLGNAEGPGLQGAGIDPIGTWVESVVPLSTFRGRRVRLRFLVSTLELGALGVQTVEQAFAPFNPDPGDDGWFIDDVTVNGTLDAPAALSVDLNDNGALPTCGAICTTVTASLTAQPTSLAAPGQALALSAAASTADRCLDGVLQYRYWIDGNGDLLGGDASDLLVQNWSDNPNLIDAPASPTSYVVDVRCATLPSCAATTAVTIPVACPASGNLGGPFGTVTASSVDQLDFAAADYVAALGQLAGLSSYSEDQSTSGSGASFDISTQNPVAGNLYWYLFRTQGGGGSFCNQASTYSTGGAGEAQSPGRDASLP